MFCWGEGGLSSASHNMQLLVYIVVTSRASHDACSFERDFDECKYLQLSRVLHGNPRLATLSPDPRTQSLERDVPLMICSAKSSCFLARRIKFSLRVNLTSSFPQCNTHSSRSYHFKGNLKTQVLERHIPRSAVHIRATISFPNLSMQFQDLLL